MALTPQNVTLLLKKGFSRVLVERGAGEQAQIHDQAYEQVGATLSTELLYGPKVISS